MSAHPPRVIGNSTTIDMVTFVTCIFQQGNKVLIFIFFLITFFEGITN